MNKHLRRYAAVAVAAGVMAGGAAVALQSSAPGWRPVTYGLAETPEQLLPTTVSPTSPVRVVSTTVDADGRPVVSVGTATDRTSAARLVRQGQQANNAIGVEVDAPMTALDVTGDDPDRDRQWNLPKIRAAEAWASSTGAGATVAVLDTGVDASHPDLAGQVLPGIDLITRTQGVSTDPNGHGTHVAGTIAALAGNDAGISGVAPEAKILPVRVLGADGTGYMSDAAAGIIYAADHDADVINLSFGTTTRAAAVTNAIAYARSEGVVVVAAAGNERANRSPVSYPAADAGVIAVAATDYADIIAPYSNAGAYIDLAAPGSDILGTWPVSSGASYATRYGTSMAASHVSAIAALMIAAHPGFDPYDVEYALVTSAVDRGARGTDKEFGYGRVDAAAALARADTMVSTTAPTSSPSAGQTASTSPSAGPTPTRAKTRPAATGGGSRTVPYGSATTSMFTVTVAGRPWAGQAVQTCFAQPGTAFHCTDATTSSQGKVVVARTATASFQVMVVVPATDTTSAVSSPGYAYTVRSEVTAVRTAPGMLMVRLSGVDGQAVQVQRFDKEWVRVGTYRASESLEVARLTVGKKYRVVVPDTARIAGATSSIVNL